MLSSLEPSFGRVIEFLAFVNLAGSDVLRIRSERARSDKEGS